MRTARQLASLVAAVVVLSVAGVASAHHPGQPPQTFTAQPGEATQVHHRKGQVSAYGAAATPPVKPFPWGVIVMGVVFAALVSPIAYLVFRSTSRDLSDMKTVGRQGTKRSGGGDKGKGVEEPAVGVDPDAGARDRVWEAVTSVNQWVPTDWVARTAGLSADEALEQLEALADDGQIERSKDRGGNPIFRAPI